MDIPSFLCGIPFGLYVRTEDSIDANEYKTMTSHFKVKSNT